MGDIIKGSTVRLRDIAGPVMKIVGVIGDKCECYWFDRFNRPQLVLFEKALLNEAMPFDRSRQTEPRRASPSTPASMRDLIEHSQRRPDDSNAVDDDDDEDRSGLNRVMGIDHLGGDE